MIGYMEKIESRAVSGADEKEAASPVRKESLCATCVYRECCTLSAGTGTDIFECSEFTYDRDNISAVHSNRTRGHSDENDPAADLSLGLCATCLYRDTCTFTRPETGIWHCEEYK